MVAASALATLATGKEPGTPSQGTADTCCQRITSSNGTVQAPSKAPTRKRKPGNFYIRSVTEEEEQHRELLAELEQEKATRLLHEAQLAWLEVRRARTETRTLHQRRYMTPATMKVTIAQLCTAARAQQPSKTTQCEN